MCDWQPSEIRRALLDVWVCVGRRSESIQRSDNLLFSLMRERHSKGSQESSICLPCALSDSLLDLTDLFPLYRSPAGLWKRGYVSKSQQTNIDWCFKDIDLTFRRSNRIEASTPECEAKQFVSHRCSRYMFFSFFSLPVLCVHLLFSLYDRLCVGSLAECSSLPGCSEVGQCSGGRSALGFRSLRTSGNVAGGDAVVQGVACSIVPHLCVHPACCPLCV